LIKNIPAIILAGGKGTRLMEKTTLIPKPMVKIGKKPILWHIVKIFEKSKISNFIIATGYKSSLIDKYIKEEKYFKKLKIKAFFTGKNAMTGSRIFKIRDYLKNDTFLVAYGDGLAKLNMQKLIKFHFNHKKLATMTIVRPPARWGFVKMKKNKIYDFQEKNQLDEGWINGGFFVFNKKIFKYFKKKENLILEKDVLPKIAKDGQLIAYKHKSFWQCMDTLRDNIMLNKLWKNKKNKKVPWI